ncbi:NAD(P)-dependent dehydrogenase, short-chain alcohol dehydrogenase family [Marinobacter daqiaonensis]|uniref:NAD(P)-dependent dehydrogenase, short-chain alcohol dehydrogenase family n=1 Tax=Marinobacter daqiaonensis TaxID=650891 RepID=A0A1I6JA33_9GAMM|nr:SDR family oxidoreductase [Marinobacter daqiaonensis]SFR75826.1 NAD(P)-dependent dehydrogenase, short-chain alcohol dehydrogenase family [Marinobacter daqiaonensis]
MEQAQKVALVTGGARGIGRGIAGYLLRRHWRVVVCDVDKAAGEQLLASEDLADRLQFIETDVSDEAQVRQAVARAVEWGGRLDALINNAGLADPFTGPVEELELSVWQRRLDVNLTGPFLMAKHAAPHLRESAGSIVNMSSTRALQSEPDSEAYAATKGGLLALTHALAISLGPDVRVNSISPGWIDVRALQAEATDVAPLSETDHRQHPAGRVGRADDIAAMVWFLISGEAGFITGQNMVVDGGMTRKMIYEE